MKCEQTPTASSSGSTTTRVISAWPLAVSPCKYAEEHWASQEGGERLWRFLKLFLYILPSATVLHPPNFTDYRLTNSCLYLFDAAKPLDSPWASPFPVLWPVTRPGTGSQGDLASYFICPPSLRDHNPGMPIVPKPETSWFIYSGQFSSSNWESMGKSYCFMAEMAIWKMLFSHCTSKVPSF